MYGKLKQKEYKKNKGEGGGERNAPQERLKPNVLFFLPKRSFLILYDARHLPPQILTITYCQREDTSLDGLEIAVSSSLLVVSSFIFTGTSVYRVQNR